MDEETRIEELEETQEEALGGSEAQEPAPAAAEKTYGGMTRRSCVLGIGGAAVLLALGGLKLMPSETELRPPGGQDEDHLLSTCIRCERCVESCPQNALRPAHIEEGLFAMRTPITNFDEGWCNFCVDANDGVPLCVEFCPTHALRLDDGVTDPRDVIIGKAELNKDWCLAWAKSNGCRFCYDACPYEAITLDENNRPVLETDYCNGCGACQEACVSLQEGSIAEGADARAITVQPVEA